MHGAADTETPPAHSERVFAALAGRKKLRLVPGAGHNDALRSEVWTEVDAWVESFVTPAPVSARAEDPARLSAGAP